MSLIFRILHFYLRQKINKWLHVNKIKLSSDSIVKKMKSQQVWQRKPRIVGANVESVDGKSRWSDVSQGANGLNHLVIADGDQNFGNKESRKSLNYFLKA